MTLSRPRSPDSFDSRLYHCSHKIGSNIVHLPEDWFQHCSPQSASCLTGNLLERHVQGVHRDGMACASVCVCVCVVVGGIMIRWGNVVVGGVMLDCMFVCCTV